MKVVRNEKTLMNFVETIIAIKKLEDWKQKVWPKLITTLLEEPFMKWGLDFIGPIKPTRRLARIYFFW